MKRITQILFLLLAGILLFGMPFGTLLWGRKTISSYYENRMLSTRPALTQKGLWDGSFGTELETWFSEHVPGRVTAQKTETVIQSKFLNRPVVNGIVMEADGILVPYLEYSEKTEKEMDPSKVAERFGALNAFCDQQKIPFLYVGFPEQRIYFQDRFPKYLNNHAKEMDRADAIFADAMEKQGIDFLDMRKVYEEQGNPEEYYSIVDHHFSYLGAYSAYREVLRHWAEQGMELPVLTEDEIDLVETPYPYIGSRNRKLYNEWDHDEHAIIGVMKDPVPYERWDNGEQTDKDLFVLPAQDELPTTYNLYMGGDFGEIIMKTDRPELKNILIFGDSFTNAMETLLYASFNETHILDLRYYQEKNLKEYIQEYQPDLVLCIQNDTNYYATTGNGNVWEDTDK